MPLACLCAGVLASGAALAQGADPARVVSDIPGFDFSRLSPPARRELAQVLTDEFDFCGRPLTLLSSLKKGDACKHTRRLTSLAAQLAQEGMTAQEILVMLAKHQQGFAGRRVALTVDERQCLGPKDAKVVLVEFSDFECPHCNLARPVFEKLPKQRGDTRVCMVPYPLPMHANAQLASEVVLFARDQGKFWAVHDALFDNQRSLSPDRIRAIARESGLDGAALEKALAAGTYKPEVQKAKELGRAGGIDSTPTAFINGRKHALGIVPETLMLSIDDELDWMSGKGSWPQ